MQNIFYVLILTLTMVMASACLKQSESITPLAPVRTLAQLQREAMMHQALKAAGNTELSAAAMATLEANNNDPSLFYLNIKYNITDLNLNENADIENSYEILSNSLLRALARLFLAMTGPRDIDLDDFEVNMPDLNLDMSIVKSIKVKRVYFAYNKAFDRSTGNKASFSFINSLSLSKSEALKETFTYSKSQNNCQFKCIEFKIIDNDFTKLAATNKNLFLRPRLSITTIPKITDMRLDGQIDLQIGLLLPF